MRTRPSLLWHRWFGILGGLWLFIIAFTGSILVFYSELDHALNPDLFDAQSGERTDYAPISDAMIAAQDAFPGTQATFVSLPREAGDTVFVVLNEREDAPGALDGGERHVFVDPVTSKVQGSRVWGALEFSRAQVMPFIYKLHYELHGGAWVYWLLGVLALLWLIDHAISVAISLRSAKRWSDTFKLRKGAKGHKRTFDLHRAGGMWLLPVTATLAFTGVYFNLPDEFMAVLNEISAPTPSAASEREPLPAPLYAPGIDADRALSAAIAAQPELTPSAVRYDAARGLWRVSMHDPADLVADYGARNLIIDASSGSVLADTHFSEGTAGDVIVAWQYPLHSGKVLGWPGRIAILLAGITTCVLTVTGYLVWWRKRSARRQRATASRGRMDSSPPVWGEPAE